ncbi:hypothetical protein Cni_G23565 [Canna indica]|uniref:Plant bHLH transcription factor ACT-like domain-containing protein n=1 Tax=Canna indica TaxID=4628 RepID=A0AAQ3KU41_9LILI|nr:hypothetical protein Cni_G23565 [Canna indica]
MAWCHLDGEERGEEVDKGSTYSSSYGYLIMRNSTRLMHGLRKSSIILDASKYIKELKQKVERLNQEITCAQNAAENNSFPVVTVETLEEGFMINVLCEKSCPGMLVSVLEAFEDLGLSVLEAKASCAEAFRLQAVGREAETMDAQVVKEAVLRAIESFFENEKQE